MTYVTPRNRDQNATLVSDPWRKLAYTLTWQYGPERAAAILDGTDTAANLDQAAWRALGRPS